MNSAALITPQLTLDESFWTDQAERFLNDFIWNDGAPPLSGKLTLKSIEADGMGQVAGKEVDR
jgi:hypothetical protein